MALSKTMNLIKGEASFWADKQKLIKPKLYWADEYSAVSAGESQSAKVREYIRNQHEHHRRLAFTEEYEKFIKAFGTDEEISMLAIDKE